MSNDGIKTGFLKTATAMTALLLISKILGFLRSTLQAQKFGAGIETDAFAVALLAASLFTTTLVTAINTVMIPIFTDIKKEGGEGEKKKYLNLFLNVIVLVATVIILLEEILAPVLIQILAPGFGYEQKQLAIQLFRVAAIATGIAPVVGILRGYLQSGHKFLESAVTDLPYNLIYIFYILVFADLWGIQGLVIAHVLAIFSQCLMQLPSVCKLGWRYKLIVDIGNKYLHKALHLIFPVLVSSWIIDIMSIVDSLLASLLPAGSISAISYANTFFNMLFVVTISAGSTILFPSFTELVSNNKIDMLKNTSLQSLNVVLIITVPIVCMGSVLAKPILGILYQHGEFDSLALDLTSQAFLFLILGLPGICVRTILEKIYYAFQDTKTPMINAILAVIINIVFDILLMKGLRQGGLTLATAISLSVSACFLFFKLKKHWGATPKRELLQCFVKTALAGGVAGIAVWSLSRWSWKISEVLFLNRIIQVLICGGLGSIIYLCGLWILGEKTIVTFFKRSNRHV